METIKDRVTGVFISQLGIDKEKLTDEARIVEDLGADSLDAVELVIAMEEEFGICISEEDAGKIKTFGDAVDYITSRTK